MLNEEKSRFAGKTKLMVNIRLRLAFSFLLGLLALAFVFRNSEPSKEQLSPASPPPPPSNNNITDNFLIGALQSAPDDWNSFANVNDLGLNMWHVYTGEDPGNPNRHIPTGWDWDGTTGTDLLEAHIDDYIDAVTDKLTDINNNNGMRSFLHRPKIEWLCYGQRSDYQCEDKSHVNDDLFFYTFQSPSHVGTDIPDNTHNGGDYVRYCEYIPSSPGTGAGMVVSRLRCNTEQSRGGGGGNEWQADGQSTWYIKPRIRIDSTVAHNQPNLQVCKIKVFAEDGTTVLKETDILAKYFLVDGEPQQYYNGRYIEEFNFFSETDLTIDGAWGNKWTFASRGDIEEDNDPKKSKADIQVYWYGNCDMWIDYVRVDSDVAHELFRGDYDNNWLNWEATQIANRNNNPSPLKFFIELFEFNNIPCIEHVNKKLQAMGSGVDMIADITYRYAYHVSGEKAPLLFNAGHIKRNFIDKAGIKQVFMESYPFTSSYIHNPGISNTFSRIPNSLPVTSGRDVLAGAVSPAVYDEWLQNNLDDSPYFLEQEGAGGYGAGEPGAEPCDPSDAPWQDAGNFRYIMKTAREISKQADIPFIFLQQAHHWFNPNEVRREPTNEEMSLLTNLSVSYGAKGIVYYWYFNHEDTDDPDCNYSFGLTTTGNNKRDTNVYGQPKWDTMKAIISRLKKWDTHLMSFDNEQINSYTYRLERSSCLSETYFKDIVAYKKPFSPPDTCLPGDSPDITDAPLPPNLRADCYEDTYLQASVFKILPDDVNKYFMIVNRRCSPHIDETTEDNYGGKRFIRVFFDRDINSGYTRWNVIDLGSNSNVGTVNIKSVNPYIDLGSFAPGEGRLYRMAPDT